MVVNKLSLPRISYLYLWRCLLGNELNIGPQMTEFIRDEIIKKTFKPHSLTGRDGRKQTPHNLYLWHCLPVVAPKHPAPKRRCAKTSCAKTAAPNCPAPSWRYEL